MPVLLILISILFVACAPDESPRVTRKYDRLGADQQYLPGDLTTKLLGIPFGCADSSQCPQSVGLIGFTESERFVRCTGFLVAEDTVATNSHCIPESVKRHPKLCTAQLAIKFLTADGKGEVFSCDQFVYASTLQGATDLDADYAFFKIKPAEGRRPYQLSREGLQDKARVSILSMQPVSKGLGGFLVRRSCDIQMTSVFGTRTSVSPTQILVGEQCNAQPGNSGSPVFREGSDVVVGILHGSMGREGINGLRAKYAGSWLLPGHFSSLGVLTNLSCLWLPPDLASKLPMSSQCAEVRVASSLEDMGKQALALQFGSEFYKWLPSGPHPLRFRVSYSLNHQENDGTTEYDIYLQPLCLLPRESWSRNYMLSLQSVVAGQTDHGEKLRIRYSEPRFVFQQAMRSDFSVHALKTEHTLAEYQFEFDLSKEQADGTISGVKTFQYEGSTVRMPIETHWCSPEEIDREGSFYDERDLRIKLN